MGETRYLTFRDGFPEGLGCKVPPIVASWGSRDKIEWSPRAEEVNQVMAKSYLTLQQSEAVVLRAAAQIYAGYIAANRVVDGQEDEFMERAIRQAIRMAKAVDAAVISDGEVD